MGLPLQSALVCVTLVTGATAAARETAVAAAVRNIVATGTMPNGSIALILEGFPSGSEQHADALDAQCNPVLAQAARIAPGCLCCVGNLTLKVTLNRILRQRPQRLRYIFISLADATHIDRLRAILRQPPYDCLLKLEDDMQADITTYNG